MPRSTASWSCTPRLKPGASRAYLVIIMTAAGVGSARVGHCERGQGKQQDEQHAFHGSLLVCGMVDAGTGRHTKG